MLLQTSWQQRCIVISNEAMCMIGVQPVSFFSELVEPCRSLQIVPHLPCKNEANVWVVNHICLLWFSLEKVHAKALSEGHFQIRKPPRVDALNMSVGIKNRCPEWVSLETGTTACGALIQI